MTAYHFPTSAAERYDRALRRSLKRAPAPAGAPEPQPTAVWPNENIVLLERYRSWLVEGGAARSVIDQHRIPMAGYVLGLALKPYTQLNLDTDWQRALKYIESKPNSTIWQRNCGHSLNWFRRFLQEVRGLVTQTVGATYGHAERYQVGLPDWLLVEMKKLLHFRQPNWRPSRRAQATYQFWQKSTRIWRWLYQNGTIEGLGDITRHHLYAYIDEKLVEGYAPGSINLDLYTFQSTLRFLQQRGFAVPAMLLTLQGLKEPNHLPRFLTDEQVRLLRDDLTARVAAAKTNVAVRNTLLDRAVFYLLWQGGLRVSEVEDLTLDDLHLAQGRLIIRRAKGLKDRSLYLTAGATAALKAYLVVRGQSSLPHLFLYRNRQMSKDLVRCRIKAAGKRTGVKVSPHRLRHTFGTQLVNAGAKITTIQALLGHNRLNTTMIYARVHDQTVADDYFNAMRLIEKRLDMSENQLGVVSDGDGSSNYLVDSDRMVALVDKLEASGLADEQLEWAAELRASLLATGGCNMKEGGAIA